MNEELDLELDVIDLGDAKEVTLGNYGPLSEDNAEYPTQRV